MRNEEETQEENIEGNKREKNIVPIIRISLIIAFNCRTVSCCFVSFSCLVYLRSTVNTNAIHLLSLYNNFFHDSCSNAPNENEAKMKTKISGEMIKMIRDALQAFLRRNKMTLNLCNALLPFFIRFLKRTPHKYTQHRLKAAAVKNGNKKALI